MTPRNKEPKRHRAIKTAPWIQAVISACYVTVFLAHCIATTYLMSPLSTRISRNLLDTLKNANDIAFSTGLLAYVLASLIGLRAIRRGIAVSCVVKLLALDVATLVIPWFIAMTLTHIGIHSGGVLFATVINTVPHIALVFIVHLAACIYFGNGTGNRDA